MAWTSTHGNGAIIEPASRFTVTPNNGFATVKATDPNVLTGNVHFCVPRPPAGSSSITGIKIEFSSQGATVESLTIWLGKQSTSAANNLQWSATASENLVNALSVANTSAGIDLVVGVNFDNTAANSYIRFQAVDLSYS